MQQSTIKKVITKKLEDWLSSIKDTELRGRVKSNILLTGGSITSMFLNTPVSDYDIYLKDINVLEELCRYYVKGDVEVLNGSKKETLLKEFMDRSGLSEEDLEDPEKNASQYCVAVRSLNKDQVKLYHPNNHVRNENLDKDESGNVVPYQVAFISPNAISLTGDIQIVSRFSGTSEEIHKSFDFIHATNYFTFDEGLVLNKEALLSILTKELRYQGSMYPLTSIIRVKKFIKRGWNINAGEQLKMMMQINEFDLTDPAVLSEQLIGVDVAYFETLIEILKGVNSDKLSVPYIVGIIDTVFKNSDLDEGTE